MSRTYRTPKWVIEENKEKHLIRQLDNFRLSWHYEYYITPENERKYLRDMEEYKINVARWNSYFPVPHGFSLRDSEPSYFHYKSRKVVYNEIDYNAEEKSAAFEYSKYTRDGWWNESGRNKLYKKWSKKLVRNANKRLERAIVKDDDYDHLSYPDYYLAKHLVWSIW